MTSYNVSSKSVAIPKSSHTNNFKTITLGNYKIQRKSIGKGSFSKIYVGTAISTGEQIAVKIIKKKNVKNENNILREIKIMSMIKHTNVLCLLDVLVSDNKYYLIMEYCNMGDLKQYMKDKDINQTELKYYMTQIRDGMWELHKNNIIHRDLKPQNILVTEDNCLKISDFGFAKSYIPDTDLQQTMCGSPLYMAPEILRQQKYTDIADLWSIGIIMYELYFNEVPINGYNIIDLMKNLSKFTFSPPTSKICSKSCLTLIKGLLEIDVKRRFNWNEFYYDPWFTDNIDTHSDNLDIEYDNVDHHCDNIDNFNTHSDNHSDNLDVNEKENEDAPEFCLFNMDEDENVLYRSDVNITTNYLENHKNKYISDTSNASNYIDDESYGDNYVIITSPSEMDIYSRPQIKSFDTNEYYQTSMVNQSEQQSVKYVKMKRIFNSLKDSISYMFRAKSI